MIFLQVVLDEKTLVKYLLLSYKPISRCPWTEIEYPTRIHAREDRTSLRVEYFRVCVQEFLD